MKNQILLVTKVAIEITETVPISERRRTASKYTTKSESAVAITERAETAAPKPTFVGLNVCFLIRYQTVKPAIIRIIAPIIYETYDAYQKLSPTYE